MNVSTSDPLISPVNESELSAWIKADSDDPMLYTCLMVATSAVIAFLKQDLLTRTWTYTDTANHYNKNSIHIQRIRESNRAIDLPYTKLVEIEEVIVSGEVVTDYELISGKPYKLFLNPFPLSATDNNEIAITYKAGFGVNNSDVPEEIKSGIVLVAAYYYNNSGCSMSNAIDNSGAKALLAPYAVNGGIAL